jgi:hypothetical protein
MSTTADRVILAPALGISFWDVAAGAYVAEGLDVAAFARGQRVASTQNRSAVFVFHRVPWPDTQPFEVQVRDNLNRFVPVTIGLSGAPNALVSFTCDPRPARNTAVPLYSSPTRGPLPGVATVRAEIQAGSPLVPAPWAVLELTVAGSTVRGIADQQGRVVVQFPYPEPAGLPIGSPGAASGPPLAQQTWSLQARVRFGALQSPDLCAILNQALATATAMTAATLTFGRELVLPPIVVTR